LLLLELAQAVGVLGQLCVVKFGLYGAMLLAQTLQLLSSAHLFFATFASYMRIWAGKRAA
jgi:hypothetical protein